MKTASENFQLYTDITNFKPGKPTILFLHGFTGSSEDWSEIIPQIDSNFSSIAVDLIGHGKSDSPGDVALYKIDSIVRQLKSVIEKSALDKIILCGYSMGGRVALSFANKYPQLISGLILESSTAGIKNEDERSTRIKNDEQLAEKIIQFGIEEFIDYWLNLPIFELQKKLPKQKLEEIRASKLKNNPTGLANSLLGFGTGKMTPLWERLNNFFFPVLLLSGELDQKYCELNKEMNKLLPNSQHIIVDSAGHNIHLEKPSEFVIFVNQFLRVNF